MIHDILLFVLGALVRALYDIRKHRRDNIKAMREELDALLLDLERWQAGDDYESSPEIIAAIEAMHRDRTNVGPV